MEWSGRIFLCSDKFYILTKELYWYHTNAHTNDLYIYIQRLINIKAYQYIQIAGEKADKSRLLK